MGLAIAKALSQTLTKRKERMRASAQEVVRAQAIVRGYLTRRKYAPIRMLTPFILFFFRHFIYYKSN